MNPTQCDEKFLMKITQAMTSSDDEALQLLAEGITLWPFDYRLCFLRGSIYASQGRSQEARVDLVRTIELAPQFSIAYFMLGFLDLTNNRVAEAQAVWAALDSLPEDDPLYIFKSGLLRLANDEFQSALTALTRGLALNRQYPAVNSYIQAVIKQINETLHKNDADQINAENQQTLLSGYLSNKTRH